ncbi:MAG: SAM-dependent methyltransferase [Flavobacteriaceae bacterium]|nr:SAM-dependent methyltransferase [Flavobacteriaceae bacterium]
MEKYNCKITGKKIKKIINFGKMPIANGFLKKKDFKKEFFFDLTVLFSEELSLLQLNDHPKPRMMFNSKYPFYTSSSESMKLHFKEYANWAKKKFLKKNKSKIIEIGSNDGTFLNNFRTKDIEHLGFEPSKNVSDLARKRGINSIHEFFSRDSLSKAERFIGTTDIIFGANVVCHIPNLIEFIKTADKLLNDNGKIIFEEPYLGSMYKKTSYDQIYDEHIFIFSVTAISKIFNLFDFQIIDAIPQITHGGSMRYIIERKKKRNYNNKIKKIFEIERREKINSLEGALNFKKNCELSKEKLLDKLTKIKKQGHKICGYGATSKSTTILNYCNIGPDIIDCIFDTTPDKIGKFSPGKHIPIVDYKNFTKQFYDYAFLFAWNHKKEIEKKEKNYLKKGGKWITHL